MTEYDLKIGGSNVITEQLVADLASVDTYTKKKAEGILGDKLKETRVRVGTLLKTDNVSFLMGAGASMKAGGVGLSTIPLELEKALHERGQTGENIELQLLPTFYQTISALTDENWSVDNRLARLNGNLKELRPIPLNLEAYLSRLHIWQAAVEKCAKKISLALDKGGTLKISVECIDHLIVEICRALTSLADLPSDEKEDSLIDHRRLIKKILTRPLNLRRANLFTLNYDTLIEKAADAEGAVLVDGFVGSLRRVFRPESYDLDFYFPAQTTEGRVHRFDRALHLYKLHGSITWHRCAENWENPYGFYATFYNQRAPNDDVLIYPSPLKYGKSLGMPYSELFRRFSSSIAQPQSVLCTVGYGFGDEHVNAIIRQAITIPSFTLLVVDPDPRSMFVKELKQLGDERIWIVAGSQLGTFEHFVNKLLPDLREEEITTKVMKTYNSLAPKPHQDGPTGGAANDD